MLNQIKVWIAFWPIRDAYGRPPANIVELVRWGVPCGRGLSCIKMKFSPTHRHRISIIKLSLRLTYVNVTSNYGYHHSVNTVIQYLFSIQYFQGHKFRSRIHRTRSTRLLRNSLPNATLSKLFLTSMVDTSVTVCTINTFITLINNQYVNPLL